jgi:hypothetical protein
MGFGGYLIRLNEAQVNYLGPMYSFQWLLIMKWRTKWVMLESECNFIGFLASVKNDNLHIQYSGYSMALRYCLSNWKKAGTILNNY